MTNFDNNDCHSDPVDEHIENTIQKSVLALTDTVAEEYVGRQRLRSQKRQREEEDLAELKECDNVLVEHAKESVGTIIKHNAAKRLESYHRLSHEECCIVTLGLNSILDLSNKKFGPQPGRSTNSQFGA